jgi:hypothetical protein
MGINLEQVMEGIYDAEENCSIYIGSDWDGGWRVRIGGSRHTAFVEETDVSTLRDAAEWLHERALVLFPEYAKRRELGVTRRP